MFWSNYTTITRRGYTITLPKSVIKECKKNNYSIGLVMYNNKPNTVQVVQNKYNLKTKKMSTKYIGTMKDCLGVVGFKDGNPCNFKKSNLIFE